MAELAVTIHLRSHSAAMHLRALSELARNQVLDELGHRGAIELGRDRIRGEHPLNPGARAPEADLCPRFLPELTDRPRPIALARPQPAARPARRRPLLSLVMMQRQIGDRPGR